MSNIDPSSPKRGWAERRQSLAVGCRELASRFLQSGVRWGAVVPFTVFLALVIAYFMLFFDLHLRLLLQKGLTMANGAEVDIEYLHTSFFRCEFEMKGIDVGNPEAPLFNRASVQRLYFRFLFGPLLQKKLVIQDMQVTGVAYGTARARAAALPAPKSGPGLASRLSDGFTTALKEKIGPNEISNLEGLFAKGDLTAGLEQVGQATATAKRIKEVQTQLTKAQNTLPSQLAALPDENTVKTLRSKVEAITKSNPKTPGDFVNAIQGLADLKKEVGVQTEKVQQLTQTLTSQVNELSAAVGSIDETLQQDIAGMQAKLKIPGLGLSDITPQLLGPKFQRYLEQATHWVELSRRYMPTKKDQDGGAVTEVKKERGRGTDFHFGRVASYPTFLVEKILISSNVSTDPKLGNVAGEILGVNSNPAIYGKPTTAALRADFPAARVRGAEIKATFDHVTDVHAETVNVEVNAFPVEDWKLSEASALSLTIQKAVGNFSFKAFYAEDELKAEFTTKLSNLNYVASAQEPRFAEIVNRALGSLKAVEIWGKAEGPVDKLKISLASDIGTRIASAIQKEFKAQIAAVNAKIQKEISAQVDAQKKAVEGQLAKIKADVLGPAEARLKSFQEVSGLADGSKHKLEQEKDKALKQQLEPLKKNLKLPGF